MSCDQVLFELSALLARVNVMFLFDGVRRGAGVQLINDLLINYPHRLQSFLLIINEDVKMGSVVIVVGFISLDFWLFVGRRQPYKS